MIPSDYYLMARVCQRDGDAFEALCERYSATLRRHLHRCYVYRG